MNEACALHIRNELRIRLTGTKPRHGGRRQGVHGPIRVEGIISYNSSRAGIGVCVCSGAEVVSDADEVEAIP